MTTFTVWRAEGRPQKHYPDIVTGVSRDEAEKTAIEASIADPRHRIHVIERDDRWEIAAEYRDGVLLLHRPHDARALATARKEG